MTSNALKRCKWLTQDSEYIRYHDEEWGVPVFEKKKLFEMLCLEGQQAGLSWITILKKRNSYRELFFNFDPYKISKLTDDDVTNILGNSNIVRHKQKIMSIINNANCLLTMENKGEIFEDFIWDFVNKQQIPNRWAKPEDIPSETAISVQLSKELKKRGFKFVGPVVCYSFMQACGLVNDLDHLIDCICYGKCSQTGK